MEKNNFKPKDNKENNQDSENIAINFKAIDLEINLSTSKKKYEKKINASILSTNLKNTSARGVFLNANTVAQTNGKLFGPIDAG